MKNEKITIADWDAADYIENKDDVLEYLTAAMEEKDPEFLLTAIGDIARSKGMTQISNELNLDRKGLYKSFSSGGNPSFLTVARVLDNLGFGVSIYQKKAS